jgi:heptosyltransferase-2
MTTAAPKRILIIKLGAIGDCIMVVPAAQQLHRAGYAIDWVCGQTVAPVLALYPWIHVHVVDERALLRGGVAERARAILALWGLVSKQKYELAATLYYDRRYKVLTLPVRAARKVMLSKLDRATMLLPGRHHTDEYARILTGRKDDETPTHLAPLPPPGLGGAGLDVPALERTAGKRRIALVPGGARNLMRDNALRRWPVESYVALAERLLRQGCEVVLVGGADDAWVLPHFASLPVVSQIGRLSLVETLSLLDSSDVTVTHDTGPLHMAGITRSRIVALFGPTDPHTFCPRRENCVAIWGGEDFACRPCYDGRDFAPCSHNGCIRQITPELVLEHVESLLADAREGRSSPPRTVTPQSPSNSVWR